MFPHWLALPLKACGLYPRAGKDSTNNTGEDYYYDGFGNMVSDKNKGITSISYNHLNLPVEITFSGGTTKKIKYLYDGNGVKVKKTVTEGAVVVDVDYMDGGYQYKNAVLQFFPTPEGYVDYTPAQGRTAPASYNYVFQYKDHLGNVRLNYAMAALPGQFPTLVIKEENHYYPFGLKHENYNVDYLEFQEMNETVVLYPPLSTSTKLMHNYKYNAKEWQDELGLTWYDYGARNYDPAIGRWMNIDPFAETSRRWSPYTYCYNNPLRFIDPDGMQADDWRNKDNQIVYNADSSKGKVGYTKHATAQDKQFGEALRNSGPEGKKQFDALTQSDAKIKVDFQEGLSTNHPNQNAYTTIEKYQENHDGSITLQEATIEVFMGTIKESHEKIISGELAAKNFGLSNQQELNGKKVKDNNLSVFEMAVSIFGHEIGHTQETNVKTRIDMENGKSTKGLDAEFVPERIEGRILDDFINKKKQ